jgi:hypothetical protein
MLLWVCFKAWLPERVSQEEEDSTTQASEEQSWYSVRLVCGCRTLAVGEEEGAQPSFWALAEELRIVTTIPTFLIIVLQARRAPRPSAGMQACAHAQSATCALRTCSTPHPPARSIAICAPADASMRSGLLREVV